MKNTTMTVGEMLDFLKERIEALSGKRPTMLLVPWGDFRTYKKTIKRWRKHANVCVTCTTPEKDLYHLPYYDVELSIDMEDGHVRVTGNEENVGLLLGGEQHVATS